MSIVLADMYSAHSVSELKYYGFSGVIRYLAHEPGKCTTPEEIAVYRDNDLIVVLNFEDGATNWQGGRSQGQADGSFAASVAREIGYPTNCVIPFSIDADTEDFELIFEYLSGASGYGYPIGVYGSYAVIEACMNAGVAEVGWQTAAWSRRLLSSKATLYQNRFAQSFDYNLVVKDFPQAWGWNSDIHKPTPIPTPNNNKPVIQPTKDDDEMDLLVLANGDSAHGINPGDVFLIQSGRLLKFPTPGNKEDLAATRKRLGLGSADFSQTLSCNFLHTNY